MKPLYKKEVAFDADLEKVLNELLEQGYRVQYIFPPLQPTLYWTIIATK